MCVCVRMYVHVFVRTNRAWEVDHDDIYVLHEITTMFQTAYSIPHASMLIHAHTHDMCVPCVHAGSGGHKQVESTQHKLSEFSLSNGSNNSIEVISKTIY